jgi:hypothetical protein
MIPDVLKKQKYVDPPQFIQIDIGMVRIVIGIVIALKE